MCGIVGYIGNRDVKEVLLNGLSKLEYRGYDSAGIALKTDDEISIFKENGRLDKLAKKVEKINLPSQMGIGHTRWATHGKPSEINAHPHFNKNKTIAVVHNGIIENYLELKNELIKEGYKFITETDTEVLAHLLDKYYEGDAKKTLMDISKVIRGSYAICAMFNDEADTLYCMKKDSPLIIGKGEKDAKENFIASDIPAILEYTKEVYILEDNEIGVLTKKDVTIYDTLGNEKDKPITKVTWTMESAEKGGYEHYMLKEMHEQPHTVRDTLNGRLSNSSDNITFENANLDINEFNKIYIVACGTAFHAGLIGKYLIEKLVRIPIFTDVSSEFRYRDPIIDDKTLVIAISQSGETADTLAAIRLAKERKAKTLGIVNVIGSSIDRECDYTIHTCAGPEIAVASTKAYTAQVICMYLLSVYIAKEKNLMQEDDFNTFKCAMLKLSSQIEEVLAKEDYIKDIVKKYIKAKNVFYIGRGMDYYVAKEGSLKLKEIAYLHSESYQAGELKHGPIALMESATLVVGIVLDEDLIEKTKSNLKEVKARGAKIVVITEEGLDMSDITDDVIYIPKTEWAFTSVLANIPQQMIAYYFATLLGNDVDKPRNLAKSVTVE
ncbi:MAG: glutamine--fructose-6-phosphate transaminase (isomerizing) [Clostridia bacterium]|nr:glutamine--fructose-6-phosphate transaminase (isomerizing) [Clostridia bacterium]